MDIKEIQSLIRFVAKSGASEVSLEMEDVKITIKTTPESTASSEVAVVHQMTVAGHTVMAPPVAAPPAQAAAPAAPAAEAPAAETDESKFTVIKSPIIGTFYRKPAPDKPNFVEVGSQVNTGDTLCVIEAMKLFNDIESEVSGKIVKILVEDSSPVEFDQPLFLVDPS
jgi:acetyl-CoA carboxylase biotin carboxyl carrier protein